MKGGAHYHLEGLVEVRGAWLADYFDLVGGGWQCQKNYRRSWTLKGPPALKIGMP
jgi:hypothetical protein